AVGMVAAVLTFAFSAVHGQAPGGGAAAAAAGAGRPAMAGAQGGLGVQAGVPQGGIGVQGNDAAERAVRLSMPLATGRAVEPGEVPSPANQARAEVAAAAEQERVNPTPKRDGNAVQKRSTTDKATRATKRSIERARTGVGKVDSSAGTSVR
ncbi:MAG: hypothetical protein ABW051_00680, partial [Burkholderiaceae bacterium]